MHQHAGAATSCNWLALKAALQQQQQQPQYRRQHAAKKGPLPLAKAQQGLQQNDLGVRGSETGVTPVVALDCEMVGVGPMGAKSALAR